MPAVFIIWWKTMLKVWSITSQAHLCHIHGHLWFLCKWNFTLCDFIIQFRLCLGDFWEVVAVSRLQPVPMCHQIILSSLVRKKDDGQRPEGTGWKIKPSNSFTEMSVEHTHRSIRQWKWHSRWYVFFPLHTLKMLVLIDTG